MRQLGPTLCCHPVHLNAGTVGDHREPFEAIALGGFNLVRQFAAIKGIGSIASNLVESQAADGTLLQKFGPVFPNPYDRTVVYVLTTNKGVQVSNQAGDNFQPDAQLNTLLNSDAGDVNQIAFNYDSPASVVVGTESGKLFFSSGGGVWKDLTSFLPTVPIPIRSVAIDCEAIYVGTLGRGVLRVRHYSMG